MSLLSAMAATQRSEWTLDELARMVQLPKSTTHRLLEALSRAGFVEPGREPGHYRFGLQANLTGIAALRAKRCAEYRDPILAELCRETEETVGIAVLSGMQAITIERVLPNQQLQWYVALGAAFPAHCSVGGKVLLAALTDDEFDEVYRGVNDLARYTPQTIRMVSQLRAHLKTVRECGLAIDDEEFVVGHRCLGVPVHFEDEPVRYALGISGPSSRLTVSKLRSLAPRFQEVAAEIATRLYLRFR